MRNLPLMLAGLALLSACASPRLDDARAQQVLALPGPQHYAERIVARELAGRCVRYAYDEELADTMSRARVKAGVETSVQVRGAADLEADIKRRTLAARYGATAYGAMDPCQVLDSETAAQTPMSVLVRRRG
ncbi:hypothetical protein [Pseudooceanicola sp.]|uniref:hypothetical protein n=1 Tax=Pseudooceanicola sp. TaxID=1914328 RepID=UPI0035124DBD